MGCLGKCLLPVLDARLKAARPVLGCCCNEGLTQDGEGGRGGLTGRSGIEPAGLTDGLWGGEGVREEVGRLPHSSRGTWWGFRVRKTGEEVQEEGRKYPVGL